MYIFYVDKSYQISYKFIMLQYRYQNPRWLPILLNDFCRKIITLALSTILEQLVLVEQEKKTVSNSCDGLWFMIINNIYNDMVWLQSPSWIIFAMLNVKYCETSQIGIYLTQLRYIHFNRVLHNKKIKCGIAASTSRHLILRIPVAKKMSPLQWKKLSCN